MKDMMYRFALIGFFLVTATLMAADPLKLVTPGVTDGHISKKCGHMDVIATNAKSDEPLVFAWISVEKKSSDGKFYCVRTDIDCPIGSKCCGNLIHLKKNESINGSWDFRSTDAKGEVETVPGVYRFVVISRYSEAIEGYVYHGVSKEFTILE